MDTKDADTENKWTENKDVNGSTLLCVFERGCVFASYFAVDLCSSLNIQIGLNACL